MLDSDTIIATDEQLAVMGMLSFPVSEGERYHERLRRMRFFRRGPSKRRFSWEDIYLFSKDRESAIFDACFFDMEEIRLRKEAEIGKYYCSLSHQNP